MPYNVDLNFDRLLHRRTAMWPQIKVLDSEACRYHNYNISWWNMIWSYLLFVRPLRIVPPVESLQFCSHIFTRSMSRTVEACSLDCCQYLLTFRFFIFFGCVRLQILCLYIYIILLLIRERERERERFSCRTSCICCAYVCHFSSFLPEKTYNWKGQGRFSKADRVG